MQNAIKKVFEIMKFLPLPAGDPSSFELETDWSGKFSGYMLFSNLPNEEKALMDVGSRPNVQETFTYFVELETKVYRGRLRLVIGIDSHGVMDRSRAVVLVDDDVEFFRRWA